MTRVLLESRRSTRWLLALTKAVFSIKETGTLESRNSCAPSHWGSLAICETAFQYLGDLPVTQIKRGAHPVCARCSHGWEYHVPTYHAGRYGWDTLPDIHPGLVCNRLQLPPAAVNYSNWQSPAKRGAIQDLCSQVCMCLTSIATMWRQNISL